MSESTEYALTASLTAVAALGASLVLFAASGVSWRSGSASMASATPGPYATTVSQPHFTGNTNLYTPAPPQRRAETQCHPTQANSTKDNGGC